MSSSSNYGCTYSDYLRSRRANGATQTFRRPSHATTPSGSTAPPIPRDASAAQQPPSSNPGVYVPPHAQYGRNGSSGDGRYTRDQLLQYYRSTRDSDEIRDGLSNLYVGGWEPNISNGTSRASWGRQDDHSRDGQSGVDQCWDKDGAVVPLSLADMTDDEKEVCVCSLLFALLCLMVASRLDLRFIRQFPSETADPEHQGQHAERRHLFA